MTPPLVSVVMPVRNAAACVGAAVASIVGQDDSDLELVVVDDGSDDATPSVLRPWVRADPRVRVVAGTGSGPGPAFDLGVSNSRGRLVARMDSDDVALPWRISRQVQAMRESPATVMVGGYIELMDAAGGLIGSAKVPLTDADIRSRLPFHCFFNPTLMFRRAALAQLGGHRHLFDAGEDVDLTLRLAELGLVSNLPEALVRYRIHESSETAGALRRQVMATLVAQESFRRRAAGASDPVDVSSTLDEAAERLGITDGQIASSAAASAVGRAELFGAAGLPAAARQLILAEAEGHARHAAGRIKRAAWVGRAGRTRDDLAGCRASRGGASLRVRLALVRFADRIRAASIRLRALRARPEVS